MSSVEIPSSQRDSVYSAAVKLLHHQHIISHILSSILFFSLYYTHVVDHEKFTKFNFTSFSTLECS